MAFKVKLVKEVEFELPGGIHKVREPSMDELADFYEKTHGQTDTKLLLNAARSLVESLGFPKEYYAQMTLDSLNEVIQVLTGEKKS